MRIERELMRGAGPVAVLKLLESGSKYGYELVKAEWRDATATRPRKYYALTAKGKKRLAHDTAQWRAVERAMRGLGVLQPTLGGATG